jgi:hypothetical protein
MASAPPAAAPTPGGSFMDELSPFPASGDGANDADFIFDTFGVSGGQDGGNAQPKPDAGAQGGSATASPGADAAAQSAGGEPGPAQPAATPTPAAPAAPQSATGVTETQVPGQPSPPAGAPAPTAPAAAPAAPSPEALRVQSLEATVQALQESLRTLQSGQPATQPGQPGAPAAPAAEHTPLSVPPEIGNALFDENVDVAQRQQALTHLVNGIDAVVRKRVMTEVDRLVEQRLAPLVAERSTSAAEVSRQQYYEQFPDHKNPNLRPIIEAQAAQLWGELPSLPWNKDSIAALGARVNAALSQLGVATGQPATLAPPQAQPGEQPPVAQRPAAMSGTGTRPSADPAASAADFISNTFK